MLKTYSKLLAKTSAVSFNSITNFSTCSFKNLKIAFVLFCCSVGVAAAYTDLL
jgi:hypothetical protein